VVDGVGRLVAALGQDHGNNVTDVFGFLDRHGMMRWVDHVFGHGPCTRQRSCPQLHVLKLRTCVDGEHAVHCDRGGGIDGHNPRVCERRAHHTHPQLTGRFDVIHELGFASEELRVLLAEHAIANAGRRCFVDGRHDTPPAESTAFTMLWYPVHRQRLPSRPWRTWCSDGLGYSSTSETAAMTIPGVQFHALQCVELVKRLLHGVERPICGCQPLDGRDVGPFDLHR